MKKTLLLLTILLLSISLNAQNENSNTISVNSTVYFQPKIKEYEISIILSLNTYGRGKRYANLDELKSDFFKIMQENGISASKFEEAPMKSIISYNADNKEQSLLILRTTKKEDVLNLMKADVYMQLYDKKAYVSFSKQDYSELSEKCLKKAKETALLLAEKSGKKLGEIKSIITDSFSQIDNSEVQIYDMDRKRKFNLYVTFFIE